MKCIRCLALAWLAISSNTVMLRGFSGFIKPFEVENFIHYTRFQQKISQVWKLRTTVFKLSQNHRIAEVGRDLLIITQSNTPAQAGSARAAWPRLCPAKF